MRHKRGGHAACAILYVDIHMHLLPGAKFSSIPIHVPRYPSTGGEERREIHWQRSCDRIPVHPVSRAGTIRPAIRTREVSFCLGSD